MEKKEGKNAVETARYQLEALSNELATERSYQPIEYSRLAKDVERVRRRLVKGEYFYTDFTGNTFNIPERTREYFIYFNSYFEAARTWAKVLEKVNVHRFSQIADLCPGWAPKLELALFYLQYQGKVVLLDKDRSSLEQNESFIRLFNPHYTVESRVADLFDIKEAPGELVLANHLIDDLLLSSCANEAGFDASRIYEEEDAMRSAWEAILKRESFFFPRIVEQLGSLFSRMLQRGGCLVLTQYQAYVERLLDLDEPAAFCKRVALAIVKQLQQCGWYQDNSLVADSLSGYSGWFGADECFVLWREPA